MSVTFFFYDLETSGVSPREARIMQFAGQRADLNLQPVGEPINQLIKLTPDILPDPEAILLTGITPQATLRQGLSEADFLKIFTKDIALPNTIFVGFNNIRFDDEFVRCLHYRNFYDPYEWQWQAGRSRWDLLDVVRMTRALRPEGIKWPFAADGSASNRLQLITSINGLDHAKAHDALSDVGATMAVAKLIFDRQPKLFNYLLSMRDKQSVASLVLSGEPFVYTSGKYPSDSAKTTVVACISAHPKRAAALVYDLRYDPSGFKDLSATELAEVWRWQKEPLTPRLPIKTMRFNCCPAIAPLSVLDKDSYNRLKLDSATVQQNYAKLESCKEEFVPKVLNALDILDGEQQTRLSLDLPPVDGQIYDGFFGDGDRKDLPIVRSTAPEQLSSSRFHFKDRRLEELLPLYKARNFPSSLTEAERQSWEDYRQKRLVDGGESSRLSQYFARLQALTEQRHLSTKERQIIEELKLYGESLYS